MDNQSKEKIGGTKQRNFIIIAIGLVVIIAAIVVLLSNKMKTGQNQTNNPVTNQEEQNNEVVDASTPINSEEIKEDLKPVEIPNVEGAKVLVEGANAITPDNKVITETGKVTENVALPMSENAPKQTGFLEREELSKGVVQVEVGKNKFTPSQFSTKAGAPTTFSLTGVDDFSHVIAFDDPSLTAIAILVGPGQTKAITFNAPTTPGNYTFYCASPDHATRGEKGVMIVK